MLMICAEGPVEEDLVVTGCEEWAREMSSRGVLKEVAGLRPPGAATTVRVRGEQVLLSDGPFAETKEQIGGFCLLECADEGEAVEVAARHPFAAIGMVEVRAVLRS